MEEKIRMVSVKTMRDSDAYTIKNLIPSKELMWRAGQGIFDSAEWKPPVAVVCGKGNNAGDGYVVAELLKRNGIECTVFLLSDMFSEDGGYYFNRAADEGVAVKLLEKDGYSDKKLCMGKEVDVLPLEQGVLEGYNSICDCILGTGFSGKVKEPYASAIEEINRVGAAGAYVVSADINSGLNGDTGEGELYVKSDLTVSIGTFKFGHFRGMADDCMKNKVNVDIGIVIIE